MMRSFAPCVRRRAFACVLLMAAAARSLFGAEADPPPTVPAAESADAQRLVRLGLALGDRSDRERDYYLKALEAQPGYAPALFHLAELRRGRGENDEALKCYLEALAADPSNSITHFSLADFLWHSDVDPSPAEGASPRYEIHPKVRRLELAREHFQRYLDLQGKAEGGSLQTETRLLIGQVEGDLAAVKNAQPVPYISWEEAARRLKRPADPAKSPYEGPRIPLAVEFEKGSYLLSYRSTYLLDAVARALESEGLRGATILIEGHADASGETAANQALSKSRAQSVRDYFVSRGLRPERFLVAGFGAEHPIVPNSTEENHRMNRRIEIVNWDETLKARGVKAETPPSEGWAKSETAATPNTDQTAEKKEAAVAAAAPPKTGGAMKRDQTIVMPAKPVSPAPAATPKSGGNVWDQYLAPPLSALKIGGDRKPKTEAAPPPAPSSTPTPGATPTPKPRSGNPNEASWLSAE
ncbi:MAG: OmpA family protein [Candidatus Sumerlaeota bacterium]|nr:OmpA family protein [Candidatus Sumerlaeota bacterium]